MSSSELQFAAPALTATAGCEALRAWANGLTRHTTAPAAVAPARGSGRAAAALAASPARLVWVAGKGGVGKSTCAAAMATLLAETRSVCIVSTDPAGSLTEIFDRPITTQGAQIRDRLYARQVDALAELERMRNDYRATVERVFAELGLQASAALDRHVIETFFDFAPPGIDEIIALLDIMEHARDYDVIIIDSAPTGHFLRLLELPEIVLQWLHALMRLLVKTHTSGRLDALGQDLLTFSKRLRQLKLDLSAPDIAAVYVVTLDEPLVAAETQRLCAALAQAHIPVAAIILNRAAAGRAQALRPVFSDYRVLGVPDAGDEIVGASALRSFVNQWEIVGE